METLRLQIISEVSHRLPRLQPQRSHLAEAIPIRLYQRKHQPKQRETSLSTCNLHIRQLVSEVPKLPLKFAPGLEAAGRRKTKEASVLGQLTNRGCCEVFDSLDSGTTPWRSLLKCGDGALSAVGTPWPGDGSLGVRFALPYAFLRMTQAAIQTCPRRKWGSSRKINTNASHTTMIEPTQCSTVKGNGSRIRPYNLQILTSSAQVATKRTILRPYNIRSITL